MDEVGEMLDLPALKAVKVVASDALNEEKVKAHLEKGAKIDVYGIGTNLVTCESQPALGMVYKLVSLEGEPKMKSTSSLGKATLPG